MLTKRALMSVVALSLVAAVLSGLSGSVPALASDDNTYPAAPAADRIGPETRLSLFSLPVDDERYQPAVAYNWGHDEYLVVWHRERASGGRDIVARRVTRHGELKSWFVVSTGTGDRAQPDVAYNSTEDEYLVVWMEDVSGAGNRWAIKGRIIPWDGAGSNPELPISDHLTLSSREPSVAYDSFSDEEYLVIWNNFAVELQQTPTSVAGRRVNGDGTITEAAFVITADGFPHQSDIVFINAADKYLVVWVRVYAPPPGGTGNDIWGGLLYREPDGSLVIGTPFSITHSTKHENRPAVSSNDEARFMVVFEYEFSDTDTDIYGQELDYMGEKVGASPFAIALSGEDETSPDVVGGRWSFPAQYFAAWQVTEGISDTYESIMAKRWGSGLTGYTFQVAPWYFWDNLTPAVATDGVGYLTAYAGKDLLVHNGKSHIYMRMWWPVVVFVPIVLKDE